MKVLNRLGVPTTIFLTLAYTLVAFVLIYITISRESINLEQQKQDKSRIDEQISFGSIFPLCYRAVGLFLFGIWCWIINVSLLSHTPVQPQPLLFPTGSSSSSSVLHPLDSNSTTPIQSLPPKEPTIPQHHQLINLSAILTVIYSTNLLLFIFWTNNDNNNSISSMFPLVLYGTLLGAILCPYDVMEKSCRVRLINGLKRSLLSPFTVRRFSPLLLPFQGTIDVNVLNNSELVLIFDSIPLFRLIILYLF